MDFSLQGMIILVVLQGSVLGPFCLLFYIVTCLTVVYIRTYLFAGATKLFQQISCVDGIQ